MPSNLPSVNFPPSQVPGIAANINSAQAAGYPSVLTRITDKATRLANRAAATRGFSGVGSPDEYPFASTAEGGVGAQVADVPLIEQLRQGGVLSRF